MSSNESETRVCSFSLVWIYWMNQLGMRGLFKRDWCVHETNKSRKLLTSNYRPVSLTSVISKVLEKIIRRRIVEHLTDRGLLADRQHGFMAKRSCLSNVYASLTRSIKDLIEESMWRFVTWTLERRLIR